MVKQQKEKKEDDLGQEVTDHSSHLRKREYDKECYYCVAHGCIQRDKDED